MHTPDFLYKINKDHPPVRHFGVRSIYLINKRDLAIREDMPDVNFDRVYSKNFFPGPGSITRPRDGAYFFTGQSDTTFFTDNHLQITPKIVDIAAYPPARREK